MRLTSILIASSCATLVSVVAMGQSKDLNAADQSFLKSAAMAQMTEAHLGQMAENNASQSGVKDFGRKLDQDHTSAYDELAAVASKVGATIPRGIDIARDRSIEQLAHLKGPAFDQRFLQVAVEDHRKALAEFKREATHGKDDAVKAYANKMLPTIEEHLHKAEELEKSSKHAS